MANKTSRLNPPEVQSAFKEGARPTNEGRKCQMRHLQISWQVTSEDGL